MELFKKTEFSLLLCYLLFKTVKMSVVIDFF